MRIRLKIPPLLLAVAFLLQLSAIPAQAGHLSTYSQETTPRPTVPKPPPDSTRAPTPINRPRNPLSTKTPIPIDRPKPGPTATPTVTPTFTQTMDLSLNNFLIRTLAKGNPTNTTTPFVDHSPTQNAITVTLAVTYSASLQTITPVSGMNETVTKGLIIPFVISVIILVGIFSIRGLLRKRF